MRRALTTLLCGAGLAWPGVSPALDRSRSLLDLHHTAWTLEAGAPADVWALAQTRDGYFWLGTGAGLYRFDGVRFERLPSDPRLTSDNIISLTADADGRLWAGCFDGEIAVFRDGRLETVFRARARGIVRQIVRDRAGRLWAAVLGSHDGGLELLQDGRWRTLGPEWGWTPGAVSSLLVARDGALWVAQLHRLYRLPPGATRFVDTGQELLETTSLAQGPDGRIWISRTGDGPRPLPDLAHGAASLPVHAPDPHRPDPDAEWILFDRDGALWGSLTGGLLRYPDPERLASAAAGAGAAQAERFTLKDGLTADIASHLLEDAEGVVWLGTNFGLDRFRNANAVTARRVPATARDGFTIARAPGAGGAMLVAANGALQRVTPDGGAAPVAAYSGALPFLGAASDGTTWLGTNTTLHRVTAQGLVAVPPPPGPGDVDLRSVIGGDGRLWTMRNHVGLFRRDGNSWTRVATAEQTGCPTVHALAVTRDGSAWLNCHAFLARVTGGRAESFDASRGLDVGAFEVIVEGADGLLVSGDRGVARFAGGRFTSLRSDTRPVLRRVSGIVQTAAGDTWLNGPRGIARLRTADLDRAFAGGRSPGYDLFTLADGLPGVAQQDPGSSSAVLAGDGRVWLETNRGVAWIDPAHLWRNPRPPPVAVSGLRADGVDYDPRRRVRLPAGVLNLAIDYTALSLSFPERVRFRYRLSGVDRGWVDPGGRRQAFYTSPPPGAHVFEVMAANNDGVWNRSPATVAFEVAPTFLQSRAFPVLLALLVLATGSLLYLLRVRQLRAAFRATLEARVGERERIARELHDTLLQGFQAVVLRFQAVAETTRPEPVRRTLEDTLQLADRLLTDGRRRILDLRSPDECDDLPRLLREAAARLQPTTEATIGVQVEGAPVPLTPAALEELGRIGEEAVFNASRHARASAIEVRVSFRPEGLKLVVRDDGVGVDAGVLARGARPGHFGLPGMRERARRLRGRLRIANRPGAGAEVEVTAPGRAVYARRRSLGARLFGGRPK